MAIKKLNFSFEVPITALLGLIATGNSALKIDVFGDDKTSQTAKLLNGAHPKIGRLEGPKKAKSKKGVGTGNGPRQRGKDEHGKPITAYNTILRTLAKAPNHTMLLSDLRSKIAAIGLNPSSANSQISLLRTRNLAKRIGEGEYRLTANGLHEAERRGLVRPKAAPKADAPVTESDNG